MVICFYPGAGGNRYLQMLREREYTTPGISYDRMSYDQTYATRYLLDETVVLDCETHVLTHCLNHPRIEQMLVECVDEVLYIVADFKKCLMREWCLEGIARWQQKRKKVEWVEVYNDIRDESWSPAIGDLQISDLPAHIQVEIAKFIDDNQSYYDNTFDVVNSAFDTIRWHHQYYQMYPVIYGDDVRVLNIDTDDSKFASVMRNELNLYHNEIFELAWSAFTEFGCNAPIIDIFSANFSARN